MSVIINVTVFMFDIYRLGTLTRPKSPPDQGAVFRASACIVLLHVACLAIVRGIVG